MNNNTLSYRDAGVDIDQAALKIKSFKNTRSHKQAVISGANDFAGLFSLKNLINGYENPTLVCSTDGIGTKIYAAIACENYLGLGQDLVAMCANDIAVKGAKPLFFLDYYSCSNLKQTPLNKIVDGIARACDEINCALIGGETAEMPSFYPDRYFDLAGFIVGLVDKKNTLGPSQVKKGDAIIGLSSSGLHANGFSLVRKVIFDKLGLTPHDVLWQNEKGVFTVEDELLRPTKLYVTAIQELIKNNIRIHSAAHITGGGLTENVPRALPPHLNAFIDFKNVDIPRIFEFLHHKGPIKLEEMFRTFNMGIGLVLTLNKEDKEKALHILKGLNEKSFDLGSVIQNKDGKRCIIKNNSHG